MIFALCLFDRFASYVMYVAYMIYIYHSWGDDEVMRTEAPFPGQRSKSHGSFKVFAMSNPWLRTYLTDSQISFLKENVCIWKQKFILLKIVCEGLVINRFRTVWNPTLYHRWVLLDNMSALVHLMAWYVKWDMILIMIMMITCKMLVRVSFHLLITF